MVVVPGPDPNPIGEIVGVRLSDVGMQDTAGRRWRQSARLCRAARALLMHCVKSSGRGRGHAVVVTVVAPEFVDELGEQ
jgi:hypothetical protein